MRHNIFNHVFGAVCAALALIALIVCISAVCGCSTYKGGKVVEGTDIAAGMSVPQSGGTFQVDALNFLTGFRFMFAENAGVECTYCTTNSVRAFGVYESETVKHIGIRLTPTMDGACTAEDCAASTDCAPAAETKTN